MKRVLIPWSGGLDSTALIFKNLEEGNHVTAVYFKLLNNSNKTKRELKAIHEILKHMMKYNLTFSYLEKTSSIELCNVTTHYNLSQPPIWLFSSFHYLGNIDEVQISYIMNDDAISYLDDIKNLYDSLLKFSKDKPELCFPF